jgi:hypothetical protein
MSRFHLANSKVDERRHDLDAGVADEDINGPECLDDLGRSIIHLLLICDVQRDADNALPSGIDLARSGVGCLLIEVCDGDLCAFAREDNGNFLSDAARCTGDDRDLIFQTHGTLLSE